MRAVSIVLVLSGGCHSGTPSGPTFGDGAFVGLPGDWEIGQSTLPDQQSGGSSWAHSYVGSNWESWSDYPCTTAGGTPIEAVQGLRVHDAGDVDWVFDGIIRCDDWSEHEFHASTAYARLSFARQEIAEVPDGDPLRYDWYDVVDVRGDEIDIIDTAWDVQLGPQWSVLDIGGGWVRVRDDEVTWLMAHGPIDWDE
jgi:hypothetical protein